MPNNPIALEIESLLAQLEQTILTSGKEIPATDLPQIQSSLEKVLVDVKALIEVDYDLGFIE